ncbi:MAG TPA: cellulase family glycosylhydrolase [Ktedonobacteraceae bacterium]|nr:cellulase family glycosylhydrolase [Ktedonobacteraceae bacterium]
MYRKIKKFFWRMSVVLVVGVLCFNLEKIIPASSHDQQFTLPLPPHAASTTVKDNAFVTHSGSTLRLAGKPFRFSGANIYWLGLQETTQGSVIYPTHFRIDDALATAAFMGATVVRSHTLGGSVGCKLCLEPERGVFQQQAWESIDYAIQSAHKHHIKLIIPLIDNWHYYHGGKHTFTDWRGLSNENDFYTNTQVIGDFEDYIRTFLNHVNQYTGLAYKDDPTILAWETGNELSAPANWVGQISTFIKKNDPCHLVMDGNYEQANEVTNFASDLSLPAVDIYTGHYYPPSYSTMTEALGQAEQAHKVFIVGEYDWEAQTGEPLASFLSTIERSQIAGDMYWSLFSHDDHHGFVAQNEYFTLHYPGYTTDVRVRIRLLRLHAYRMQGSLPPAALAPGVPLITTRTGHDLIWRGAYGADTYTIERSAQGEKGPWQVVCNRCVTDFTFFWRDPAQLTGRVAYRMRAFSDAGIPGPYSQLVWIMY